MTIQELIAQLQQYDPDTRVVIRGYEGGVNDVGVVEEVTIARNVHGADEWYYGRHEILGGIQDMVYYQEQGNTTVRALHLHA